MTIDAVRALCRALPNVTEDVKWGHDLCFCVHKKMFAFVSLERPHSIAFKCTPETFGELVERPGIIPAPYMARNMWVQEQELGEALDRRELAGLVKTSYELVVAKLPKSKRAPVASKPSPPRRARAKRARSASTRK
jgi:predicted DNA-binding protein (MmcQ/YjbR family)